MEYYYPLVDLRVKRFTQKIVINPSVPQNLWLFELQNNDNNIVNRVTEKTHFTLLDQFQFKTLA